MGLRMPRRAPGRERTAALKIGARVAAGSRRRVSSYAPEPRPAAPMPPVMSLLRVAGSFSAAMA